MPGPFRSSADHHCRVHSPALPRDRWFTSRPSVSLHLRNLPASYPWKQFKKNRLSDIPAFRGCVPCVSCIRFRCVRCVLACVVFLRRLRASQVRTLCQIMETMLKPPFAQSGFRLSARAGDWIYVNVARNRTGRDVVVAVSVQSLSYADEPALAISDRCNWGGCRNRNRINWCRQFDVGCYILYVRQGNPFITITVFVLIGR